MKTELTPLLLGLWAALALAGLWRAGRTGSRVAWGAAIVGLALLVGTFLLAAAPQINRPPENEAEAYYRGRYETADLERRNALAQLEKVKSVAALVDEAVAKAARLETANKALGEEKEFAVERTRTTEEDLRRERDRREQLERRLTKLEADNNRLDGALRTMTTKVDILEKELAQKSQENNSLGVALRRSQGTVKLLSVQQIISRSRNKNVAVSQAKALEVLNKIGSHFETERFSIDLMPNTTLLAGRKGMYFKVTFRPANNQEEIVFQNLEPPFLSNAEELMNGVRAFAHSIVSPLEGLRPIVLVRGSADTRPIRNQPNEQKLSAFTAVRLHGRLAQDQYTAQPAPCPNTIQLPLQNADLPNLRANFLASRMTSELQVVGSQVPTGVLEQRPTVIAQPGEAAPLRPEVFLFVPEP